MNNIDSIFELGLSYLAKLELLSCKELHKIKSFSRNLHKEILLDKQLDKNEIIMRISDTCKLIQRRIQYIEAPDKIRKNKIQEILIWLSSRETLGWYDETDLCIIPLILSFGHSTIDFDEYFQKYVLGGIPLQKEEKFLNEEEFGDWLNYQFEYLKLEYHYFRKEKSLIEGGTGNSFVQKNVIDGFFRVRHILNQFYLRNKEIAEFVYPLLIDLIPCDTRNSIVEGHSFLANNVSTESFKKRIMEQLKSEYGENKPI